MTMFHNDAGDTVVQGEAMGRGGSTCELRGLGIGPTVCYLRPWLGCEGHVGHARECPAACPAHSEQQSVVLLLQPQDWARPQGLKAMWGAGLWYRRKQEAHSPPQAGVPPLRASC
jgi:hypothetical protein